ncbi:MAG: emp24/gp25L/p24 family protein [Candidatus Bathyarchaeia archaeon]|jgi:hypothetical protein
MQKQLTLLALTIVVLLSMTTLASCSQTFTVPSLHDTTIQLSLNQGDVVTGSLVVSGGLGNDIDFYVTDPQGNSLLSYSRIIQTEFSFQAPASGNYTLHFDNTVGLGLLPRTVTLDYNIIQSIAGIARSTFLLIIAIAVVVLIVVAAIILVLLRRSHH